jgi:polysaccharide deacetylase family protein (PEP-CTERM system associated)
MKGTVDAPSANAFSIDVEDWFHVSAFESVVDRAEWDRLPSRVERNVRALLDLLAAHEVRATFFTLGWVAERHPALVRAMAAGGHEVASHGHAHRRVGQLDRAGFREDVIRSKAVLEDLSGARVAGFRAPSFSIGDHTPWAFDVLAEAGLRYSSSVYPVKRDLYGSPHAPRFPYRPHPAIVEIPPSSVRLFGRNLPAAGGGFFRLLPYRLSAWSIARINRVDRQPAIFYCHPWEIDPDQPRVAAAPLKSRLRHYCNLRATLPRLERLLGDGDWDRVDRVFAAQIAGQSTSAA